MTIPFQSMAANLLAIIVMKIINQLITFQFGIYNSNLFYPANGTCQLKSTEELAHAQQDPVMNIFHTGYMFAVFGGLLANKYLGFRTVLGIGGALMSVGIGLIGVSIQSGLICQKVFYIFVWLFHPLYMALVLPCLFYGFVRWSTGPVSRLVLTVLFYGSTEVTPWINLFILPLITKNVHWRSLEFTSTAGLFLSLVFTTLSLLQKPDDLRRGSEWPTTRRLARYFQIFSAFTLFAIQLEDGHLFEYHQELVRYTKSDNLTQTESNIFRKIEVFNVPRLVNMCGILSTSIALIATHVFNRTRRIWYSSPEHRIQIGILIAGSVAMTCFIADVVLARLGPASPILTATIFCTAALLDGVAEILTMVGLLEFVILISPRNQRLLLAGIVVSIWCLAYYLRLGLRYLTFDIVLKLFTQDPSYKYCATHGMDFLVLVACLAYTRWVSVPLAFTLVQDQEQPETETSEQIPLLSTESG